MRVVLWCVNECVFGVGVLLCDMPVFRLCVCLLCLFALTAVACVPALFQCVSLLKTCLCVLFVCCVCGVVRCVCPRLACCVLLCLRCCVCLCVASRVVS